MVLFLEIEGVLHPMESGLDQLFCRMPALVTWLQEHPLVRVVIFGSDCPVESTDVLKAAFPSELQDRVVGLTTWPMEARECHDRADECLDWLRNHGDAIWVALDSWPGKFEGGSGHVVLCDPRVGLTTDDLSRTSRLLHHWAEQALKGCLDGISERSLSRADATANQRSSPPTEHIEFNSTDLVDRRGLNAAMAKVRADRAADDDRRSRAAPERRALWTALSRTQRWVTIFLDIEGVLCIGKPSAAKTAQDTYLGRCVPPLGFFASLFSKLALRTLRSVQAALDQSVRFVISSSWCDNFCRPQMEDILLRAGAGFIADNLHEGRAWRTYKLATLSRMEEPVAEWSKFFYSGEPWVHIGENTSATESNAPFFIAPPSLNYGRYFKPDKNIGLLPEHISPLIDTLRTTPGE